MRPARFTSVGRADHQVSGDTRLPRADIKCMQLDNLLRLPSNQSDPETDQNSSRGNSLTVRYNNQINIITYLRRVQIRVKLKRRRKSYII
jgi:hypothetical protein